MRERAMKQVTIRVPATTANLGPGFDAFGCALSLYTDVTFEETDSGLEITGCDEAFTGPDNLAYTSYCAVLASLSEEVRGVKIHINAHIPICRGLGSSAALLVAGAMGANVLRGSKLSTQGLLNITNAMEGHPDNLAPAIFGGLVASFVENERPYIARYSLHKSLRCTALIPDFQLSTHLARSVLPKEVPYGDAVFNVSRTAVLLRALENGDAETISVALRDKLHQPFRRTLIPGFDEAEALAHDCGCVAFFLSGAGPTLLCLSADPDFDEKLASRLSQLPGHWQQLPLPVDHEGIIVS